MLDPDLCHHVRYLEPIPIPGGSCREGRLVQPVEAVLFDIYGTLFISGSGDLGVLAERTTPTTALSGVLQRYDIKVPAADLVANLHRTIRTEHQRKQADGIVTPEVDIETIWQSILGWQDADRVRAFALEVEWTLNPAYPMPGLDHTLRVLRNRGYLLGLISNAQFYTPFLFEGFLGARPEALGFDTDLTIYSYRYGEAKPSKTLFNSCSVMLRGKGLRPSSVVYIGNDMLNDIRPAWEAGWQTVLFAGDRRSLRWRRDRDDCRSARPDLIITELRELLDWV